jgi:hypothetical protein
MPKSERTTRIILTNGSRLLHDMLKRAIDKRDRIEVVAEVKEFDAFPQVASEVDADWVYLLLPPGEEVPDLIEDSVNEIISMDLLVMSTDGSKVRIRQRGQDECDLEADEMEQIFVLLEDKVMG